jgi:hypothetical protein
MAATERASIGQLAQIEYPSRFDWKHPEYAPVFKRRAEALMRIRQSPGKLPLLKAYYRDHIAQFIMDWGVTEDPRNVERGLPSLMPFILFPKQIDWIDFVTDCWRTQTPGLTEKSRDGGLSWLAISYSCSMCLFHEGMAIGFGSRKETYVDQVGAPKSLFHKARVFMRNLPVEFRGGWDADRHAPHMRINFPESKSNMSGEAGDNIGRGDRTGIYFVDESAHLEHPDLVEQSLSATTNCRQDISSVNGMNNPFAVKRFSGRVKVFTFHWKDDPRKDDAWYAKQRDELDPVTLAQEVDIDYNASVEGIVIPREWVLASVDAHIKLNVEPTGDRSGSLDVADEGRDSNAFCGAYGILVEHVEEWSGKGGDIFNTVAKAFDLCDQLGYKLLKYDGDGLGAGVRGDARVLNEKRIVNKIAVDAFRGSEAPFNPEGEDVKGRLNKDFFANRKAQGWWSLRTRFLNTFRAVVEGHPFKPDEIISISSKIKNYQKLLTELSQPTRSFNVVGKTVIDKAPDGSMSPNLADAVMIRFGRTSTLDIWARLGKKGN